MNEISKETAEELKERIEAAVDNCVQINDYCEEVIVSKPQDLIDILKRIVDQYVMR
jgi:hypothetical protein